MADPLTPVDADAGSGARPVTDPASIRRIARSAAPLAVDAFGLPETESRVTVDWRDLPRILRRRRWPALTVFVLCVVLGVVHASTRVPVYQARTRLLIEPDRANVTGLKDPLDQERLTDGDFQTQFMILQSRSLARKTMERLGVWNAPVAVAPPLPAAGSARALLRSVKTALRGVVSWATGIAAAGNRPAVPVGESAVETMKINGFMAGLRVVPLPGSRLVDVYYESTDRFAAAQYANTAVAEFIRQNMEFKFLASKEVADWLADRLAEQRKALEASERQLQAYREQHTVAPAGEQATVTVQKLSDLTTAYTRAKTERIEREAVYNQLQSLRDDPSALDALPSVLGNSVVQQLRADLLTLQRQQAQLAEKFGERHPSLIKIRDAVQAAEARLHAETLKVAESIRREFFASRAAEESLAEALEAQKRETLALNRSDIQLAVLQRDAESNKQIYESLLQRVNEFGVTRERRTGNIRVIDAAETPQVPLGTGARRDVQYGAVGGLLLAMCAALLLEMLDSHVKTPDQIKTELGLPFLGLVPLVSSETAPEPLLNEAPPPAFGEALRGLRTNVRLSIPADGPRILVVTSPCPGDGKTLVASNLALALAMSDHRVMLVDADLRRPRIHEVFGEEREGGLTNLLVGDAGVATLVRRTSVPRLDLLTSGSLPPNPSELLDSRRFRELLAQLGDQYDWVILDSPPVLPVTDAVLLAVMASGVVLVTAADVTPLHAAKAAVERLTQARARVLGALLNRADLDRRAYYYGRSYQSDYNRYYQSTAPAWGSGPTTPASHGSQTP